MERDIIHTKDGSATLASQEFKETYHSVNGALTETSHIFINNGIARYLELNAKTNNKREVVNIFEVGFGTGLNCLATAHYNIGLQGININYNSIEKFPLSIGKTRELNHLELFPLQFREIAAGIYDAPWNIPVEIFQGFNLNKIEGDLVHILQKGFPMLEGNKADVVYYDAFSPGVQPELWQPDIFKEIYHMMGDGAVLVTYSAKGVVKSALRDSGFEVSRVQGPPGKRHILVANKKRKD